MAEHNHARGPNRPNPLLALHPGVDDLGRQKRREKAAIWGLFGLLGNMIALVVYLLVRENGQPSENS